MDFEIQHKNVFIIGKPASGKTYLAKQLSQKYPEHILFHTDDFIRKEHLLHKAIREADQLGKNYVLEGNLALKLLPYIKNNPDLIIEIQVDDAYVNDVYKRERNIDNAEIALTYYLYNKKAFDSYLTSNKINIPKVLFKK